MNVAVINFNFLLFNIEIVFIRKVAGKGDGGGNIKGIEHINTKN